MKRMMSFLLVFVLGGIAGIALQYWTSGAVNRARIAALEDELKSRNDKLDKCTDVLINGMHSNAPAPPAATGGPK